MTRHEEEARIIARAARESTLDIREMVARIDSLEAETARLKAIVTLAAVRLLPGCEAVPVENPDRWTPSVWVRPVGDDGDETISPFGVETIELATGNPGVSVQAGDDGHGATVTITLPSRGSPRR